MCEKHMGQCFVLRALHRLPSYSSVFTFCFQSFNFFFSMMVLKLEIISQSVLTWLEHYCFSFLRKIRNAVGILAILQACKFFLYPAAWMRIYLI